MDWIDPGHLPEASGVVDCSNGEDEADGLVLKDGTETHVPPHMGWPVLAAVRPGTISGASAVWLASAGQGTRVAARTRDARRVDAWPGRGMSATQLGPNRNGRTW